VRFANFETDTALVMTDSFIGKFATAFALVICVLGVVLPQYTPAPDWASIPFGIVRASLILLWFYSN